MNSKTFQFFFFLLKCLCFLNQLSQTKAQLGNETDLQSLISIKDNIEGLESWNSSLHFCQWEGITCGKSHQRVVSLNLSTQSLIGSLSPSIGNLSFLRYINLERNRFSGRIPQEIGRLFRLEDFIVYDNTFIGEIPVNLTKCSNLRKIDFQKNNFTGSIPSKIGSLVKLTSLYISENKLTGGIPVSFGNLSALQIFWVGDNNLDGRIPDTLGRLTNLEEFIVELNKYFTGEVPISIYNISSLTTFSIVGNRLTGSLPPDLGITLPNIETFLVNGNALSGTLPFSLANASNLQRFNVLDNHLTGDVPKNLGVLQSLEEFVLSNNHFGRGEAGDLSFITSLTNCSSLTTLSLSFNNFGGVLPMSISNISSPLQILYLGNNSVSGPIPEWIGNFGSLIVLGLDFTNLSGRIPSFIGNMQMLQQLYLHGSKFTGEIPSSLANITELFELLLSGNRLEGSIPSSFAGFRSLQFLNVSQNNLNGTIPKEVFSVSSLSTLDLSQNYFTGSLPAEVGNLNNLQVLDVSGNKLSGEVPGNLGKCTGMEILSLQNNSFQGALPQSLKSLKGIQYIDFSSNNFSGEIPKYLEDLPFLEGLVLSNNKLEGEVPTKGVFQNPSDIEVDGNLGLCGGVRDLHLKRCPTKDSKKKGNSKKGKSVAFILAISIAAGLVFLAFCALLFTYMRKKPQEKLSSSNSLKGRFKVSYGELFRATDGFSPTNFLGSGGFGRVYKGKLDHDETFVAVKVFDLHQKGASKSFTAECNSLRGIRHRNLVKVVTSCSSTDYEGNDFKALVFEFMSNKSLDDWLHPNVDGEDQSKSLNLLQRLNVAADVATALNYLHRECHTTIIHRDLKPSNVLLDDDMVAHVGDFGLAKLLWGPKENMSETQTITMGIKGSIGYTAPEYGMGGGASTQGDTFSYGILVLELFTGRRPTDESFVDGLDMHNYAKKAMPNNVRHIVDPGLISGEEEVETIEDCLASVVKIGVECSAHSPGERMNMEKAAKDLHSIRDRFLASVQPPNLLLLNNV